MKNTTKNNIADVWYKIGINVGSALILAIIVQGAIMEDNHFDKQSVYVILASVVITFGLCYIGFAINEHGRDDE